MAETLELPPEYLTREEFCDRLKISLRWFDRNGEGLPGYVKLSPKVVRVHMPTFNAGKSSVVIKRKGRKR
jgi:hypothetical protein